MFTYFYSGGTHQPLQDTIESIELKTFSKQIAVSAFYYLSEVIKVAPFNNSICSKGQFLFSQSG